MALLDRFRSLPAGKHPDPEARLAYVEALPIDAREQIAAAAQEDESPRVRRAAVSKLMDPAVLAAVARDDADPGVRAQAVAMLRDIALEAFEETGEAQSLSAVDALSDPKIMAQVAKGARRESVAARALGSVTDAHTLGSIARHALLESIRRSALAALADASEILAVAMHSEFKDTAVAAVERLPGRAEWEEVAARSANKSAAKHARALLRELDESTADSRQSSVGTQQSSVSSFQSPVSSFQSPVSSLQSPVSSLQSPGSSLESPVPSLESPVPSLESPIPSLQSPVSSLQSQVPSSQSPVGREEQRDVGRTAVEAIADERARKDAERRRMRLTELVGELEAAVADEDLRSGRRRVALVEREWKDLTAGVTTDDALAGSYAAGLARWAAREAEARTADARTRRAALETLEQLLSRVEPLAARNDVSANLVERALRDVRSTLTAFPPLPSRRDHDDIRRRLKAVHAALVPKRQELRAIEDWQRWANVGILEALCEKIEALKAEANPEEILRRVRDLQRQWRLAADVPRAQGALLWRRFKAAHDEVWGRCEAYFAAAAQRRAENLAKKLAVCERAEALADSTAWLRTAEELKRLQAEWKTIGAVSPAEDRAVWKRFRAACGRFFTRRREDLIRRRAMWAENLAKKEALCVKAEALAESDAWDAAAQELRRLQAEWKTIGPVKRSRADKVWERFRGACDRFFARYAARHEMARAARVAAREAICAELEALALPTREQPAVPIEGPGALAPGRAAHDSASASQEPPPDLLNRVRSLRAQWQREVDNRDVDSTPAAALDERFAVAFDRVLARWPRIFSGTDLDLEANRQRMEALVTHVENMAASLRGAWAVQGTETARLAAMLKEALATNTIGGKIDEDARRRAAQEDLRRVHIDWARIGPVAEPARRQLADRFQRACRLIAEQTAHHGSGRAEGTGSAGRAGETGRAGGAGRTGGDRALDRSAK